MSDRHTTVEDAIWDASRNYGETIDATALESALERAGWSGPTTNFDALADLASSGHGSTSAALLADALEDAGWSFAG